MPHTLATPATPAGTAALDALRAHLTELEAIQGALGVLEWDQQVYMPGGGSAYRGEQQATLRGIAHDRVCDPQLGDWLDALQSDPATATDPGLGGIVRNLRRRHERARAVPTALVKEHAAATAQGFADWLAAREADAFATFAPSLRRILAVTRETVACQDAVRPAAHPYDQLLADYDPGATTASLVPMFDRLRTELSALVAATQDAAAAGRGPAPMSLAMDPDAQLRLSHKIVAALGFQGDAGRLDISEHPFTMGVGPRDVRLTTHILADDLLSTLGGTIHETGHGLYEQGLPDALRGTSLSHAAGMGLHESQSRFWENMIGRSRPFCDWLAPLIRAEDPSVPLTGETLYAAANTVQPSLVRVQADEATYNLHIIVRFDLERRLVTGELDVADLPAAWNAAYEDLLGVTPAGDKDGVLQDVHWSAGLLGYFPSYTIGNLWAASFLEAMQADLPHMWDQVRQGEFGAVLGWLRTKIHSKGHILDAPDIFAAAVGDRDPVEDLLAHLRRRHGALYGV